jgi:hypothetical protein
LLELDTMVTFEVFILEFSAISWIWKEEEDRLETYR